MLPDQHHTYPRGLVVSDLDGVLTDGGLYYSVSGEVMKKFNARDGVAFARLKSAGYATAILSLSKSSSIVTRRAQDLSVDFMHSGDGLKEEIVEVWMGKLGISWSKVFYIGDDIQDLAAMKNSSQSACPSDASKEILDVADVVLKSAGGAGCFREWVDYHLLDLGSKY
jgi:YrbI family 3-deoxy-D-manno-octulosonate 8-phosphate phosphatase